MKPALSTNGKQISEELFKAYSEAGLSAMEISPAESEYADLSYENIKNWADKYGVTLWSFHLPFTPFDKIEISEDAVADQTVEIFKDYIRRASEIGIKVFVIHPSGEPIAEENRKARMECAKKSLKRLAEFADTLGCIIAVEDLPRSCLGNCSAEIAELISVHSALRVCFDTNHLLGEEITDFIAAVGDKIITTHISDYDYENERHWLPGEGKIEWQQLIRSLKKTGYDGYLLYEIAFNPLWSISRPRALNCADFKKNFEELVAEKAPTPIGKPKENLGLWNFKDKE